MSERPTGPVVDLAEWVAYLRDIGVREMKTPGSRPAGRATPAPRGPVARPVKPAPALLSSVALPPVTLPLVDPRLAGIRAEIGDCQRCKLHEQRTHIVFGVGPAGAQLMFIGEGPGADEDARGEPFVGRAGKKLDEMIKSIGLRREDVYIANVVKCRPPNNREPEPNEVATCSPFLFAQIAEIKPKVIVTLGAPAARTLLNTRVGITRLRGQWQEYSGIPVMPTFHPAYLLRAYTEENRRVVWSDLKAAKARLDEPR